MEQFRPENTQYTIRGIYGERQSVTVYQNFVDEYINTIPKRLADALNGSRHYAEFEREMHNLLSISMWIFGGVDGFKKYFPRQWDAYELEFNAQLLKLLKKFSPEKGNWISQVHLVNLATRRALFAAKKKKQKLAINQRTTI